MEKQVSCPCKTSNNLWTFNWTGPHYIVVNVDASILQLVYALKPCTFNCRVPFRSENVQRPHTHYWKGYCGVREIQW